MLNDPYQYLALQIFKQAFHDINAYYTGVGRADEIVGGRDAVDWIRKMQGTYRTCCLCTEIPIEKMHQICLEKINQIRDNAIDAKYSR